MSGAWKFVLPMLVLVLPSSVAARQGLYVRFSLGPGVAYETSVIKGAGLSLPAKDHAIGYGFTDHFGVQVADFGALVHKQVGGYRYMNLDALGPGVTMFLLRDTEVSVSAGYGAVAFARKWSEPTGSDKADGFAASVSVRKEWPVAKQWGLGVGTQACSFRTSRPDYTFFILGAEGALTFHLASR